MGGINWRFREALLVPTIGRRLVRLLLGRLDALLWSQQAVPIGIEPTEGGNRFLATCRGVFGQGECRFGFRQAQHRAKINDGSYFTT